MQILAPYDAHCQACPYHNQTHLTNPTIRIPPPVGLEDNNSDILLVFQSPGEEEWKNGKPLQPTKKRGGTAGKRIELSWQRSGKTRTDFDIANAVQCFQGKRTNGRDAKPKTMAVCCCSNRLLTMLRGKNYTKIIAFGDIAQEVLPSLISKLTTPPNLVNAPHPTSGTTKENLDDLWKT